MKALLLNGSTNVIMINPLEIDPYYFVNNVYYPKQDYTLVEGSDIKVGDQYVDGKFITTDDSIEVNEPTPIIDDSIEVLRELKRNELSLKCNTLIIEGLNIEGNQYSLKDEDQINLSVILSQIKDGATIVSYHPNGKFCTEYTSEKFLSIYQALFQFKVYNTTYCNLIIAKQDDSYLNRCKTASEINSIYYGIPLLEDLELRLETIMQTMNVPVPSYAYKSVPDQSTDS